MRDVETAINEAVTALVRQSVSVSGRALRCRLHPLDYGQLMKQIHSRPLTYTGPGEAPPLGMDTLRMQTVCGAVDIESSPSYQKGVVALMCPEVMDPAGIRPLSYRVLLYECCDECGARAFSENLDLDEREGTKPLTQCRHTLAVSGCDAWLCEDCEEQHDEKRHVRVAEQRARREKEREERVTKAKASTLNEGDFQTRMRQKRAAKKAWETRRAQEEREAALPLHERKARQMQNDIARKLDEDVAVALVEEGPYEDNAFLRLGAIFGRTEDDTTVRAATIAAMYWLGAEKRYGEVAAWPAFSEPIRTHIVKEIRRGSVLGEPGEDVPRAVARLEDTDA